MPISRLVLQQHDTQEQQRLLRVRDEVTSMWLYWLGSQ
jgi:hypothetical protein